MAGTDLPSTVMTQSDTREGADPASVPGVRVVGAPAALDQDDRRLVLSDLLNRVLDRGLVVTGSVMLAVADIDLVRLDLQLALTAVETAFRRAGPPPPLAKAKRE